MHDPADHPLWHPFAAMDRVRHHRTVISRAEDVWVFDDTGKRYLDGTAALWYSNVGHGRREIIDAIRDQLDTLDAYQVFNDFANEPALRLAGELAERAPMDGAKIFFTSGGGDSIDTAAKMARAYFAAIGQPDRTILLHREHSYHGTHGLGTSLAGIPGNRVAPPFVPDVVQTAWNDAEMLEETIRELGAERVAAFFCEPVIGAGGVLPPPPGYLEAAAEVCARHGVLFVADAVICGFGRLGNWFGIERFGVRPDLVVFAKGVTSGYQPLGGVVVSGRVAEPFWDRPGQVFKHGQTYSGHPVACAAALATIGVLERDGLLERARQTEETLAQVLKSLADHPLVDHVRAGTGVLGALELDDRQLTARPDLPAVLFAAIRERGVLVRPMGSSLGFSPPLTVTDEHLDLMADAVRIGLDSVGVV
ncbi:MAG: adenosylmethionine-8-amino-7-oxononanoate aminotransferase [Pseudonocardia sp.]|uniref:aminotransferase family protein n=1 Tax=Pseudonocardia sp. TaxID=60912 RepID=UPI002629366B|nr:aspartate aminotransferase family protein [Pseudonocardia sp.]MCU1627351.1 adenosylmethionine-8-amino-7-oxononanoate aminotransferase [Pseudonocardia sp.]MDT7698736.1 putrescine---pyruvate transaminase [Pseudonocardiales bacterium]HEV7468630.1 aspartate aminotransferase family protein [Pseudonocardia sp.]